MSTSFLLVPSLSAPTNHRNHRNHRDQRFRVISLPSMPMSWSFRCLFPRTPTRTSYLFVVTFQLFNELRTTLFGSTHNHIALIVWREGLHVTRFSLNGEVISLFFPCSSLSYRLCIFLFGGEGGGLDVSHNKQFKFLEKTALPELVSLVRLCDVN